MNSHTGQSRLASLDVLRGVAILLVLFNHMPAKDLHWSLGARLQSFGWTGVDLFFVLSGYLISSLLFRELNQTNTLDVGRFLLRRGLKIWPSYFVAYGIMVISHTTSFALRGRWHELSPSLLPQWPNLIFVQNYWPASARWPHSWSLAVEEHFYIALPLLLLFLWKAGKATLVPRICAFVGISILVARLVCGEVWGYSWDALYYPTHLRADGLMFGVLIGYLHTNCPELFHAIASRCRFAMPVVLIVPFIATVFPLQTSPLIPTVGFTLFYVAYGILVTVGAEYPSIFSVPGARTVARCLRFLGRYSYTIYLAHSVIFEISGATPMMSFVDRMGGPWAQAAVFFIASITAGLVLSRLVELPILAFRDRWIPANRRPHPEIVHTAAAFA
jgi:peptidoglycan/LPS O-acetylase OafA/YrhL